MTASVDIDPTSGNITHLLTAAKITCSDEPSNDSASFDASEYPTEPAIVYKFVASLAGQDDLVSNTFSTNPSGTAEWPSVLFPAAGTWSVALKDTSDDSTVTSISVVVA